MKTVWVSFGSNSGNTFHNCKQAIHLIDMHPACTVRSVSSFYRTEPLSDFTQPWFLNGVLEVQTRIAPFAFLDICRDIENRLGRRRTIRWGPRTMDLDILIWRNSIIFSRKLKIPHPQMHLRRFVLTPLAELCPELQHPVIGKTIRELLLNLDDPLRVIRLNLNEVDNDETEAPDNPGFVAE